MMRTRILALSVLLTGLFLTPLALAANEGQKDLDEATELQFAANTLSDIQKVISLCESALEKGLDEESSQFARELLVSALWQHASQLSKAILEAPNGPPRNWQKFRAAALDSLGKLVKVDNEFTDAYLLQAKLRILLEEEHDAAMKAANKAVELAQEDGAKQAEALVLRARLRKDPAKQLADLNAAIEADPQNVTAWQFRAVHHLAQGQMEEATKDFEKLLEQNPNDVRIRAALIEALVNLEKYELALEQANGAIEFDTDSALGYMLRAEVYEAQEKTDEALADLNKALEVEPRSIKVLMMRTRLHLMREDLPAARSDVEQLLKIRPDVREAILLRSIISAAQGRFQDAIKDVQSLLQADHKNIELRLQLASLYVADQRPRRAIGLLTEVLGDDKESWRAMRARGDALLSVGKHAEAIEDYDRAMKIQPDDTGILNNLAWVLATSPFDEVRDGRRSIELATKACELSDYKMPHILSTLAAGYAETDDFETAIEWSTKAVELGKEDLKDQIEQLQNELDSYKRGERWRELQELKEKPDPPRNVIET